LARYEEAVADLSRAVELDPEDTGALAERGEAYRLMGRYEEAVTALSRGIGLDPEHAWAFGMFRDVQRQRLSAVWRH
jgi:tetratricopeptide (TPR) repeat protein